MIPRSIKVMADYGCWPLWHHQSATVGNIDPASLPISSSLASAFAVWSSMYDSRLNLSDPAATSWANAELLAFVSRGADLAALLQRELGTASSIFYFSERSSQLVRIDMARVQ
jgi:hypothetical protein